MDELPLQLKCRLRESLYQLADFEEEKQESYLIKFDSENSTNRLGCTVRS